MLHENAMGLPDDGSVQGGDPEAVHLLSLRYRHGDLCGEVGAGIRVVLVKRINLFRIEVQTANQLDAGEQPQAQHAANVEVCRHSWRPSQPPVLFGQVRADHRVVVPDGVQARPLVKGVLQLIATARYLICRCRCIDGAVSMNYQIPAWSQLGISSVASNTERSIVRWVSGSACNSRAACASCVCKSAVRFTSPTLDPGGAGIVLEEPAARAAGWLNRPGLS